MYSPLHRRPPTPADEVLVAGLHVDEAAGLTRRNEHAVGRDTGCRRLISNCHLSSLVESHQADAPRPSVSGTATERNTRRSASARRFIDGMEVTWRRTEAKVGTARACCACAAYPRQAPRTRQRRWAWPRERRPNVGTASGPIEPPGPVNRRVFEPSPCSPRTSTRTATTTISR